MFSSPILTDTHREDAVWNVAAAMRDHTENLDRHDPQTWLMYAEQLGINIKWFTRKEEARNFGWRGSICYSRAKDKWVIQVNSGLTLFEQAQTLVHEIAHWYLKNTDAQWLCNQRAVYYYDGSIDEEHHELARRIELLVLTQ